MSADLPEWPPMTPEELAQAQKDELAQADEELALIALEDQARLPEQGELRVEPRQAARTHVDASRWEHIHADDLQGCPRTVPMLEAYARQLRHSIADAANDLDAPRDWYDLKERAQRAQEKLAKALKAPPTAATKVKK